jgi:predicted acylesterase/phospholipase RssA
MPSGDQEPMGTLGLLAEVCRQFPTLGGDVDRLREAVEEGERLTAHAVGPIRPPDEDHDGHRVYSKMGLTIVHKGKPGPRKKNPKVALVLAGGAVTGGAFKLGALKALDDFLVNRKTTDFDVYVGLSAGAFLAAPLASGVGPAEMLRSLEGNSEYFSQFGALDFYNPNLREFAQKPIEYLIDLITYFPACVLDLIQRSPELLRQLREPLAALVKAPRRGALYEVLAPIAEALLTTPEFPFVLDYLPSGLFDNSTIERYLRTNMEARGIPNDFRVLHRQRNSELYIVAMNLDTAERVVFGHDEDNSLTVSEAVQASTALPGFYKPARLRGVDYVDGGVRRTANIDVAIEHGADLILCYNPFRPFSNRLVRRYVPERNSYVVSGTPMADQGMLTILNQVLRTLLHSRLQLGVRQYQEDPNFQGDIILIEPAERDLEFFRMTPVNFWKGQMAGQHGYISVTQSIENHYDIIRQVLQNYGILMTRKDVREGLERMRQARDADEADAVLFRDVPRRDLHVA